MGQTPVKLPAANDRHTIALLLPGYELYIAEVDGKGSFSIPLKEVTPSGGPAGIKVLRCKDKDRYYVFVDGKPTGMLCPTERIEVDSERVQYWLGVGAQPTEPVLGLLKVTGDWQRFKGLPGAEGTLKPQPVKADKRALYEAAIAAIGADEGTAATTPRRRAARPVQTEEPPAESEA